MLYTYLPRVILFCLLFTKSLNHFDVSQVPCTITYLVKKQIHMIASLKRNYDCDYYLLLLGSYYKYGTYKCYRPIFLDHTVRIFEKYQRNSEQYV